MYKLITILALLTLVGCSMDEPQINSSLPMATTTIERLRNDIVGNRPAYITEDVIVVGSVISSDEGDNFFRTMVVDDGTSAVEVMMGINPLSVAYPIGLRVALYLKDCYAAYSYGVLQVGRKGAEYESYAVEYLGSREAVERVVRRGVDVVDIETAKRRISELSNAELGRLIEIEGLHLVASTSVDVDNGEPLESAQWGGYAMFKDEWGDSIALYTRDYARYADEHIPTSEVALCGILQWGRYNGGKECYQLKMRYAEDCTNCE